jgi:hypothetical protein
MRNELIYELISPKFQELQCIPLAQIVSIITYDKGNFGFGLPYVGFMLTTGKIIKLHSGQLNEMQVLEIQLRSFLYLPSIPQRHLRSKIIGNLIIFLSFTGIAVLFMTFHYLHEVFLFLGIGFMLATILSLSIAGFKTWKKERTA